MKGFKLLLMLLIIIVLFMGCGSSNSVEEEEAKLSSLILSITTGTVNVGENYILPATGTAFYSDGTSKIVTVIWDKSVSTVSPVETTYIASYTENNITKTANFTLIVESKIDTDYQLTITDVTSAVDGTVAITVKASGFKDNIAGIDVRVKVDTSYLEFTSGEFLGGLSGGLTIAKVDTDSTIFMGATVVTAKDGVSLAGDFFTFKFKALKTGTTTVSITKIDVLDINSNKLTGIDISDIATITIQ